MSIKKYYAVKSGREIGIFSSWPECKKSINGFSGAIYKGFASLEEAKNYLATDSNRSDLSEKKSVDFISINADTATAYVDGSYSSKLGAFSAGVIIFWKGKTYEKSQKYQDKELISMRNVAGEIKAAEIAIKFCLEKKIKALKIVHDYEGISRWADGSWTTHKLGTKKYAEFCRESSKYISLEFIKVRGHSGNEYNEKADKLAKLALCIN